MARSRNQVPAQRALVAAAKRVAIGTKAAAADMGRRQDWQPDSFAMWRAVPEIKQSMLFLGNAMGKLRLYGAVEAPDPDGDPITVTDEAAGIDPALAAAVEDELRRLRSSVGGQSELLRKLNLNLELPGEGFLVGFGERVVGDPDPRPGVRLGQPLVEDMPEEWDIKSISEVTVKEEGGKTVTYVRRNPSDQAGRKLDPDYGDDVVRIYQADPEWSELADSPMQGVLFECRLLQALTHQQLAVANSQMHSGVFTLPNELSFGPANVTDGEDGDDATQDPFEEEFDRSFSEPIEMPDALGTVRPMLLRGPAEYLTPDYVRHITMGRVVDQTLDSRIEERVLRISRGLNLPVEVVKGHMATTFSNAEQIDQDLFDDHLEPRCRLIVDAFTIGYLRPRLTDPDRPGGPFDAEAVNRVFVWYDASALIRQPDVEANAGEAHGNNTISDKAYRAAKGFSEDDAPDALELVIRNGMKRGIFTAELTGFLLAQLADEAGIDWPDPTTLAPGTAPGAASVASPEARAFMQALIFREQLRRQEAGAPAPLALPAPAGLGQLTRTATGSTSRSNTGRDLLNIDRDLRAQLLVASNAAMERALERAGNRLRSKAVAQRDLVRDVPSRLVAQQLGRAITAAAADPDELLAGAWDQLETQFMEWGTSAQQSAVEAVYKVVGGFTQAERTALGLRQADDLGTAWEWMRGALQSLAGAKLFDPDPAAPSLGEFDPTLSVPTGLVRQAIARAGGAAGLTAGDQGGAWVTLTDSGTRPAGGIATGDVMRGVLRDHGASVEAYQWVYGPARRMRPFEPHLGLDGVVFQNFDDPVLANTSGFPDFAYYLPGDHAGCNCDVEPIIIPPDQLGLGTGPEGPPPDETPPVAYPGGLSQRKAEEWMQNQWGIDADGKKRAILLNGLGDRAANDMAEAMDDLMRRFPHTAGRVRVFGGSAEVTKALKQAAPQYRIPQISGRAYADAIRELGSIRVAASKAKKYEDLLASLARDEANGFHPIGTGNVQGIVTHEFGHHLLWEAYANAGRAEVNSKLLRIVEDEVGLTTADGSAFWQARFGAIKDQIGRYALQNDDELVAEAFAMVQAGSPSKLAQSIIDMVVAAAEGA